MKRLFYAALLTLAASAFLVFPALAADACIDMPGMHDPTVASLTEHVQHANRMGRIVEALNAFVNLVNAPSGKGIDADCAQHLVMQAQQVMAALQGKC